MRIYRVDSFIEKRSPWTIFITLLSGIFVTLEDWWNFAAFRRSISKCRHYIRWFDVPNPNAQCWIRYPNRGDCQLRNLYFHFSIKLNAFEKSTSSRENAGANSNRNYRKLTYPILFKTAYTTTRVRGFTYSIWYTHPLPFPSGWGYLDRRVIRIMSSSKHAKSSNFLSKKAHC